MSGIILSFLEEKSTFTNAKQPVIIQNVITKGRIGMARGFSETMSALRKARGLSQRTAAADLHISQALLSHYENGAREPGLAFVCRACDYYGVSADYILGRVDDDGEDRAAAELRSLAGELRALAERAEKALSKEEAHK